MPLRRASKRTRETKERRLSHQFLRAHYSQKLFSVGGSIAVNADKKLHPNKRKRPGRDCTGARGQHALLDHLVRLQQERGRDREAEGLRGLEVDDQLELRRLLDGKIGGLSALEDLVHIGRGTSIQVREIGAIGHE